MVTKRGGSYSPYQAAWEETDAPQVAGDAARVWGLGEQVALTDLAVHPAQFRELRGMVRAAAVSQRAVAALAHGAQSSR